MKGWSRVDAREQLPPVREGQSFINGELVEVPAA